MKGVLICVFLGQHIYRKRNIVHQYSLKCIKKTPVSLIRSFRIGINSRLPQHLIQKTYHDAFSEVLHHWLVLSKHLALDEFQKDIIEDQFVAVDPSQGYSQSAIGVADLMKAVSFEA